MHAIEFETQIGENGQVSLPKEFQHLYGKFARLLVLLPAEAKPISQPRRPGSAKGILKVVAEDDEHLEDFKVYMQ